MRFAQAPFSGLSAPPAASALLKGAHRGQGRPGRLHRPLVRASADVGMLLAALAEEGVKPGSVDAPIGVIIGAAVVVTAVLTFAIPAALKPGACSTWKWWRAAERAPSWRLTSSAAAGTDAAEQIFERDAKSGRRR